MTDKERRTLGQTVERERRRRFGTKSSAYREAGLNAATWDRLENGDTIREDRLVAALQLLWPDSGGDWYEVLHPKTGFGDIRAHRSLEEVNDFESWATREIGRLQDRVDVLEEQMSSRKEVVHDEQEASQAPIGGTASKPRGRRGKGRGVRVAPEESERQ